MPKHVIGIGGIFFKAKDPAKLGAWYANQLGVSMAGTEPMSLFEWREVDHPEQTRTTVWNLHPHDSTYFGSDSAQFMINYVVDDLESLMATLKQAGVEVIREMEDSPYGRFAAIKDPEGNAIELWQPAPEDESQGDS